MKPIIYRKGDTPSIDPTGYQNHDEFVALIKEVIVNRAGWELLFEDLTQDAEAIVIKNKGSGHCVKFDGASAAYGIYVTVAESFSDINTPVNQITRRRDSIYNM